MADQIAIDQNAYSGSDYESSGEYSTATLSSSIYQYRFENGRRYHAYLDGNYVLPNDEKEQDRLDIVHHMCLLMLGSKLHLSPIGKDPHRILDVGTGTGIWAIDAGETYPSAQVIGTDLSPIQPSWVPPNVTFHIDDAESEWTWPEDHFDFIHIRHMAGAIKDWRHLIKQAFKHVKPGGWVELNEFKLCLYSDDGSLKKDMHISRFYDLLNEAAVKTGREFAIASEMRPFFVEAGFENIETRVLKLPLGTWPAERAQKEMGAYFLLTAETGFEAFGMALLTRELGMSRDDVRELSDRARKDSKNRNIHSYGKQFIYYGQKPEDN